MFSLISIVCFCSKEKKHTSKTTALVPRAVVLLVGVA
jgi:hypothetical protein